MVRPPRQGPGLLGALGALAAVGLLVALAVRGYHCAGDAQKAAAEAEVDAWAASTKTVVKGKDCADYDSDNDGYVSCTVTVEGDARPVYLECRGKWSLGHGCRLPKPVVPGTPAR